MPKGLARKLVPKYIGPYPIVRDFGNGSYEIKLSPGMKKRGIHPVFHASLLRIHEPNDDRLFPGRLDTQVSDLHEPEGEWAIDKIVDHVGSGTRSIFQILWKSGDRTWIPCQVIQHLGVVSDYLQIVGVENVSDLPPGRGQPPTDDPQVFLDPVKLNL